MSFAMMYGLIRDRHHRSLYDIHEPGNVSDDIANSHQIELPVPVKTTQKALPAATAPKQSVPVGTMFMNEFRFVILTVLIVVSALTMQETMQDALEVYVRSRFRNPGRRIGMMFLFSMAFVICTIAIVISWKPLNDTRPAPAALGIAM